jgi:hypothetical protein
MPAELTSPSVARSTRLAGAVRATAKVKTGDKVATPPAKAPGLAVWAVKLPVAVPFASDSVTVRANAPT